MNGELKRLRQLIRIRRVEEAVANNYSKKEMRCPVHLSIGQEATAVGVCETLTNEDRVYSNHRCHAHYLAKGGSVAPMIAELHGKVTGCARGKGGSMHLVAPETGMMGSSALVGGTIPLAVGSALASSLSGSDRVAAAFFGDGATEEGIFYESLNFAALKRLPMIFACENNLYATYSHQTARQAETQIWKRAEAFSVPSLRIDGNDVEAVYDAALTAVARARRGDGPTFIEMMTYRLRDHVGPDGDLAVGYRTEAEINGWLEKCPISRQRARLLEKNLLTPEMESKWESEIAAEIESAFEFAKNSPFPELREIFTDIYANS